MSTVALNRAFETAGQIREKLTALQNVAADIEDPTLSVAVNGALTANTTAMRRLASLLDQSKTTAPDDATLDSQNVVGSR